ncbi:hypothetical protein RDWZM_006927 [Blomia tropicalis]|uniref:Uncharacterized protein n=1 Tax=Blomia tropicalis TaxID=40697 RepID=A0A9Q0M8H5_BLOTA|nr:hypothetical protein BLOT_009365 [Blomia tropicalis]KAJ6221115.1 hypothetical protein RDWZM_006927 [Blomia tropicalis]
MARFIIVGIIFAITIVHGSAQQNFNYEQEYLSVINELPANLRVKDFYVNRPACEIDEVKYTNNVLHDIQNAAFTDHYNKDADHHMYNYTTKQAYLTSDVVIRFSPWYRGSLGLDQLTLNLNASVVFEYHIGRGDYYLKNKQVRENLYAFGSIYLTSKEQMNNVKIGQNDKQCGHMLRLVEFKNLLQIRDGFYNALSNACEDEMTKIIKNRNFFKNYRVVQRDY